MKLKLCSLHVHVCAADVMGWPQSYCRYPAWLSRTAWLELDAQNVFTVDNTSHVIRVGVRAAVTSQPTVLKSLRCLRVVVDRMSKSASVFVALAFVSNVWYVTCTPTCLLSLLVVFTQPLQTFLFCLHIRI